MNGPLPAGWATAKLRQVTQDVPSVDPRASPDAEFSYVDISAIDNERFVVRDMKRLSGADAPSRARRPIQEGDIVFSNVRTYLRNVARIERGAGPTIASTGFTVLRPTSAITTDYLFRYVASDQFLELVTPRQTGTHYPATSDRVVRQQQVPLPPISEQIRIAGHLENVVDHGSSIGRRLLRARTLLDRFRSAVLAAACSGRLTVEWRTYHQDVATVEAALNARSASTKRRRRTETAIDMALPELPRTYVLSTVGAAAELLEYGTSKRCEATAEVGVPILRMGNIQDGRLDTSDLKYCAADPEIQRLRLEPGDLLFNRTNSPELVGKSAVVTDEAAMSFASYLIRVRFAPGIANPHFVNLWMNSSYGRTWARLAKTDGVSQSNINGTKLSLMPIPLPPVAEQAEIVRCASAALTAADRLASHIAAAELALERLARASHAKAFRGELVPTEAAVAADEGREFESAEQLLERLLPRSDVESNGRGRKRVAP